MPNLGEIYARDCFLVIYTETPQKIGRKILKSELDPATASLFQRAPWRITGLATAADYFAQGFSLGCDQTKKYFYRMAVIN